MRKIVLLIVLALFIFPVFSQTSEPFVRADSVRLAGVGTYPLLDFADVATLGMGLEGEARLSLAGWQGLRLLGNLGGVYYFPETDSVDGIFSLTGSVGAGWQLMLADGAVGLLPSVAYGVLIHLALGDSVSTFIDSAFTLAVEGSFQLSDVLALSLRPAYQIFLEEDTQGHQILLSVGINILFKEAE